MLEANYSTSFDSIESELSNNSTNISNIQCSFNNGNELNHKIKFKKNSDENVDLVQEYQHDPKYKTELCKSWSETSFCPYRNKCRFAHGKHELFNKFVNCKRYKQKECISFFKNSFCCYGSRCHFKHEERKFNEIHRSYYTYLLENLKAYSRYEVDNMQPDLTIDLMNYFVEKSKKRRLLAFPKIAGNLDYKNLSSNIFFISLENNVRKNKFTLDFQNSISMF